ncbi:MAG: CHAD domain-containing protein [Janthinobacterium lividum]
METEIKLLMPASSRATVEEHPAFAGVESRRTRNVSNYYDTEDFALRARGVSLRIRRSDDHFIQTVKSLDGTPGFASRHEWEWPIASETLDADALARDPDALALIGDDLHRLAPLFTTDVERTARVLLLEGKTTVEAIIDEGEVRSGERRQPIGEVELELKGGPIGPLLRLASDLARQGSLRFGPEAKSERGYALLTDETLPHRAGELTLPKHVVLGEAFPLMLGSAMREFALDLAPAARGDVEGVHRLRAAIRKMRTLLVLFAPHLDDEVTARFNAELRDFGRVLGGGRDWDVFLTETLADAGRDLGEDAVEALRSPADARRSQAHAAVKAAAEGSLPTDLLLGLSIWTADTGWMKDPSEAETPFYDVLPGLLERLERKVLKRGRHLKSLDVEALHELRKGMKKLRYACEDVTSLFHRGPAKRYIGAIKKVLQDLGRMNDVAVTAERLAKLADPNRPGLATATTALLAWSEKRRRASARDLRRRWRKFRHADPFWS